jgi:hypothetical protein
MFRATSNAISPARIWVQREDPNEIDLIIIQSVAFTLAAICPSGNAERGGSQSEEAGSSHPAGIVLEGSIDDNNSILIFN